jgi:hypothetical protein
MNFKTKKQKASKRPKASKGGFKDPSYTHTLSYDVSNEGAIGTENVAYQITYADLSGFAELTSFFQFAQPLRFRIRLSYTGWSGLVSFVPVNWVLQTAIPTTFLPDSLATTKGYVRVQAGADNSGAWASFEFPNQGWDSYLLYGPTSKTLGYFLFYNDSYLSPTLAWPIQAQLDVDVKFRRRNVLGYEPAGPSGRSKQILYKSVESLDKDTAE